MGLSHAKTREVLGKWDGIGFLGTVLEIAET
jgi:hypothetical protein